MFLIQQENISRTLFILSLTFDVHSPIFPLKLISMLSSIVIVFEVRNIEEEFMVLKLISKVFPLSLSKIGILKSISGILRRNLRNGLVLNLTSIFTCFYIISFISK